jgi:hypothetical protein
MTRYSKTGSGKYVVQGKNYEILCGSRAQVWHGTAYKTSGGLTKNNLMQNKAGRIVSKDKHMTAKREKRLVKAGYGTKKGKFGFVMMGKTGKRMSHGRMSRRRRGSRSRRQKGGDGTNYALSPSYYDGKGQGLRGDSVSVQFAAGQGN